MECRRSGAAVTRMEVGNLTQAKISLVAFQRELQLNALKELVGVKSQDGQFPLTRPLERVLTSI